MTTENRNDTHFELGADQMFNIPRTPRVNITCTAGELWITEAGINEDVILKRGSTYASHGKGSVVAFAFQPSGFDAVRVPSGIGGYVNFARQIGMRLSTIGDYARAAGGGAVLVGSPIVNSD